MGFTSCNHKRLGLYYLISALLFTLSGTLYSLLLRLELYGSGNRIIHSENLNSYNLSVTLHGLIMIFFVIMPVLYGGLANYLLLSLCTEFGAATGWTFYPPLCTSLMSLSPVGVDLLIIGLLLSGISSFMTSLNFFCTIINMRSYGLTSTFSSLYICAIFITALLLLLSLPVLTGALFTVFSDLHFNTIFFDATFFGHPEVYILIIPAFGVISQVIPTSVSSLLFALQSKILAKACISFLGTIVWSHHLYTVGLEVDTRAYFSAVTMLISLPTGTKIFNWL